MNTISNIRLIGGDLSLLSKLSIAPYIKNLNIIRPSSHLFPYNHHRQQPRSGPIIFPKVKSLFVSKPDIHYLYYHAHPNFFPLLSNLYIKDAKFDIEMMYRLTEWPYLKVYYSLPSCKRPHDNFTKTKYFDMETKFPHTFTQLSSKPLSKTLEDHESFENISSTELHNTTNPSYDDILDSLGDFEEIRSNAIH